MVCANCASGMMCHYHCPRCGCTWDPECDYGGWHEGDQSMPGCSVDCRDSTCEGFEGSGE